MYVEPHKKHCKLDLGKKRFLRISLIALRDINIVAWQESTATSKKVLDIDMVLQQKNMVLS